MNKFAPKSHINLAGVNAAYCRYRRQQSLQDERDVDLGAEKQIVFQRMQDCGFDGAHAIAGSFYGTHKATGKLLVMESNYVRLFNEVKNYFDSITEDCYVDFQQA